MLYSSHTTNKFNSSFPHHILYLHFHFFSQLRIHLEHKACYQDRHLWYCHFKWRHFKWQWYVVCPYFSQIHSSAYLLALLVCRKMLKGHKETENSKSTQKVRENRKPRKPGLVLKNQKIIQELLRYFSFTLNLICT